MLYCLEEADNGPALGQLTLAADAPITVLPFDEKLLGGVVPIETQAHRGDAPAAIRAIPYYAWGNRGLGEMSVWIREK
ncbi:MAG: hypothetical protein IJ461_08345 [Clostridia bacterium]|nr:hypothetical protein [Clostridia bacterium]